MLSIIFGIILLVIAFYVISFIVKLILEYIVEPIKDAIRKAKEERERPERELREKAEAEKREKEKKERIDKYKKDIESGAISYEEELKKVQAIEDEYFKYKSYLKEKAEEFSSLVSEFTEKTRPGCDWDTRWWNMTVDKIKNLKIDYPSFNTTLLSDLLEIKWDSRINNLKVQIGDIINTYYQVRDAVFSYQSRLKAAGL